MQLRKKPQADILDRCLPGWPGGTRIHTRRQRVGVAEKERNPTPGERGGTGTKKASYRTHLRTYLLRVGTFLTCCQ